ncbi:MAG: hypothetical protein ACERKN_00410 [Velocimicrobium sp.]
MSTNEWIMIIGLIINVVIAVSYLIWGIVILPHTTRKDENYSKTKYGIICIVMLLCPVIGFLFFGLGYILFFLFFHEEVDLSDIIFSKKRVVVNERTDIERDLNIAPLEEAIAISDKESLRTLMMNVIKGDVQKSLAAISLGLNSEDSETSHYAASVLRDELNEFRENVEKIYAEIRKGNEDQPQFCIMLLTYMNVILIQRVFIPMEQEYFVYKMVEASDILYQKDKENMTSTFFEWTCLRLLEIQDFLLCEEWCKRAVSTYPKELASYTCQLKLYFTMQEKEKFFETMEKLKKSNIVINNETLELIRIFS